MRDVDFDAFAALLRDVAALIPPQQPLSATGLGLYFRALEPFALAQVSAAMTAHVRDAQRGRFFPKPADIIAQLEGMAVDDGRPGPEEAWAIALRAADEADTVVWTEEIAKAREIARPVLTAGDEVGARMAFREAYTRLVDAARRQRMPAAWTVSLGFDARRRDAAITDSVIAGRLPAEDLPRLAGPDVPLLSLAEAPHVPERARQALRALSDALKARAEADPVTADAAARQDTQDRKARTAEQVAEYARQHSLRRAEEQLADEEPTT